MDTKYPINQRVRLLMKALGYKGGKHDAHEFGKKLLKNGQRTDKFKNAYNDKNGISAEILSLITRNIVNGSGQKVSGHWLLTGEGSMFLDVKGTAATNLNEAAAIGLKADPVKDQMERTIEILRVENLKLLDIVAAAIK